MIAIVDTGGANLASVTGALSRLGYSFKLTQNAKIIQSARRVLLPGVGAAKGSMARLEHAELIDVIQGLTQPVMGICLGMQLLFTASEEGDIACINAIPGKITQIPEKPGVTVPHMGWNLLRLDDPSCSLLKGVKPGGYVYFVHSFQAPMADYVKASSFHGQMIPAVVAYNNFFGCQFHPERSGAVGAQIMENFLR